MTNEQILEFVKKHFQEGDVRDDGSCAEYYGDPDAFLKFALAIHEGGYNKGYDRGYEEGYESSIVSSRMNTMEVE
jgi:flagellar biosynthesis/type III secretory pathway protein FliH